MKKTINSTIASLAFLTFSCNAMMIGTLRRQIASGSGTQFNTIHYASEEQMYTTGGITFTYPAGTFTTPPLVQVSVSPTIPHPHTETFGTEISANSATSTTIMVYFIDSSGVTEAANGSVEVCLLALGN